MSETLPTQEHDPHFDEAATSIAANLERVMSHYESFVQDEEELQLAIYKQDQSGVFEPTLKRSVMIKQEVDLTDNPDTAETIVYHIRIKNNRTETTSAELSLRVKIATGAATAKLRSGSIHSIDDALSNFVEVKGL